MEFPSVCLIEIRFIGVRGGFRLESLEESPAGFALQPREPLFEAQAPLAMDARRNRAEPRPVTQIEQRFPREFRGAMRFASAVFVIDGQLLVGFKALARNSEHALPKDAGKIIISVSLRQARERTPRGAVGFLRQVARDGLRVELSRADGVAAALADARDSE